MTCDRMTHRERLEAQLDALDAPARGMKAPPSRCRPRERSIGARGGIEQTIMRVLDRTMALTLGRLYERHVEMCLDMTPFHLGVDPAKPGADRTVVFRRYEPLGHEVDAYEPFAPGIDILKGMRK